MAMKLMYITNDPTVAAIADAGGVNRIFIDLETVGKALRQPNMDTVMSDHRIDDIASVKAAVKNAEILVRVNPLYFGSKKELDAVAESAADVVMLPFFATAEEVRAFIKLLDGRKRTCLLFETPESVANADEILALEGIDEVYIGLNDLHLGYGRKFMFELLADGTVERLCDKFKRHGLPFGFGGIARLDFGTLKARRILGEHYRIGSGCVILSRSFCNAGLAESITEIKSTMETGVKEIREHEAFLATASEDYFEDNRQKLIECVNQIIETR